MPSQAKLIKQGILLTDSTFKEISQRLSKGVRESDTLESFLAKHKDYTTNNPLVVNGYKDELTSIILQETNNHKFSRPAQKELTRATIENRVGELITRVGDDVKVNVRNIVLDGYNNGLSQDMIAENISNKVSGIGNTRARAIARTEIARTATASDYVINVERGATHFSVDCRESCCEKCAEAYQWGAIEYSIKDVEMLPPYHPNCRCYARFYKKDGEQPPLTKTPSPNNTSTTVELTNTQLKNLKPTERAKYANYKRTIKSHEDWLKNNPNATDKQINNHKEKLAKAQLNLDELIKKALAEELKKPPKPDKVTEEKSNLKPPFDTSKHLTKEQLDEMDFKQLAEHHEVKYEGVKVYDYDKRKYHTFKQTFDDGHEFTLRFEDGAVKSYTNKGIATPNEIIHEVFKVPEVLRKETREIWFKNTNHGIQHKYTKSGYDTLGQRDGGYNTSYKPEYVDSVGADDFNHKIVINPKYFKGATGRYAFIWEIRPNDAKGWKMTIHHEFIHSGDRTKEMWQDLKSHKVLNTLENQRLSNTREYEEIHQKEPYFTYYADSQQSESYAEHGGYISYMESNPSEQSKKIDVTVLENGKVNKKSINYEEYKQLYRKHHEYFMRKFKEGFKK